MVDRVIDYETPRPTRKWMTGSRIVLAAVVVVIFLGLLTSILSPQIVNAIRQYRERMEISSIYAAMLKTSGIPGNLAFEMESSARPPAGPCVEAKESIGLAISNSRANRPTDFVEWLRRIQPAANSYLDSGSWSGIAYVGERMTYRGKRLFVVMASPGRWDKRLICLDVHELNVECGPFPQFKWRVEEDVTYRRYLAPKDVSKGFPKVLYGTSGPSASQVRIPLEIDGQSEWIQFDLFDRFPTESSSSTLYSGSPPGGY